MKFDTPAGRNPIDQMKVLGKPTDRVDGPRKVTGTAPYAYERHDVAPNAAYGYMVASAIAKGTVTRIDTAAAKAAPGVLAVVTTLDMAKPIKSKQNTATLFGGATVQHYHQAIAVVAAETFEQARAAANLIRVEYDRVPGRFDLAKEAPNAPLEGGSSGEGSGAPAVDEVGDFDTAFAAAPVTLDQRYTTPDETHAMMEPHATIASWEGEKLTIWTSNQMIAWNKRSLVEAFGLKPENVRVDSPFIGGGFGGKLFLRADAVLAAVASRAAKRPVKFALPPSASDEQHHAPSRDDPARAAWRHQGRQADRDRA